MGSWKIVIIHRWDLRLHSDYAQKKEHEKFDRFAPLNLKKFPTHDTKKAIFQKFLRNFHIFRLPVKNQSLWNPSKGCWGCFRGHKQQKVPLDSYRKMSHLVKKIKKTWKTMISKFRFLNQLFAPCGIDFRCQRHFT